LIGNIDSTFLIYPGYQYRGFIDFMAVPTFNPQDWLDITGRLGLAIAAGGIVGLDRHLRHKPGGLRTHMLVSLGAALFTLVPMAMGSTTPDSLSRSIQGVATGVGFLGAGEIIHGNGKRAENGVKGLTSAASIWVTASLGVLAACGLWQLLLVATIATVVVLSLLKIVE
jgi:putative Mg2+ transporter-C (MgtC) family protein